MNTFSIELIVEDPIGLHARPAGQLVKIAQEARAEIYIGRPDSELIPIRGPLALLAMKVQSGETLRVEVKGLDEQWALGLIAKIQEIFRG